MEHGSSEERKEYQVLLNLEAANASFYALFSVFIGRESGALSPIRRAFRCFLKNFGTIPNSMEFWLVFHSLIRFNVCLELISGNANLFLVGIFYFQFKMNGNQFFASSICCYIFSLKWTEKKKNCEREWNTQFGDSADGDGGAPLLCSPMKAVIMLSHTFLTLMYRNCFSFSKNTQTNMIFDMYSIFSERI